jgi:DNA replication protein DnaD
MLKRLIQKISSFEALKRKYEKEENITTASKETIKIDNFLKHSDDNITEIKKKRRSKKSVPQGEPITEGQMFNILIGTGMVSEEEDYSIQIHGPY